MLPRIILSLAFCSGIVALGSLYASTELDGFPPEPLQFVDFCAEKCKHIKDMCTGLYADESFPVPKCLQWSYTIAQDKLYAYQYKSGSDAFVTTKDRVSERNRKTRKLVRWAANRTENGAQRACAHLIDSTQYEAPMMYPDEFELVVKTLIRLKPTNYLEWGSGASTSFYPLLTFGKHPKSWAIDGYEPWCEKVTADQTVKCMTENTGFAFKCVDIQDLNPTHLGNVKGIDNIRTYADRYVNAVHAMDLPALDAALVDGRFRAACALKLLHFLNKNGVLFMHDFWLRPEYHVVLNYYNVIGHSRSIAVLRMKPVLERPADWRRAWQRQLEIQL